jgi:eukaryotic-like serine/threonine-protein kinase
LAQAALATRKDNLKREPNNLAWRDGLVADTNVQATAQLRSGDAAAALESIQLSWQTAEVLATKEGPQSKWAQLKPALAPQYAKALAGVGRHDEALVVYDIALRPLAAALSAADPRAELHQQAQRLRAATLQVWCAKSLRASKQSDAAEAMLEGALKTLKQAGWRAEIQRDVDLSSALCLATLAEGRAESSAEWRAQAREALSRASLKQALGEDHREWLKWLG